MDETISEIEQPVRTEADETSNGAALPAKPIDIRHIITEDDEPVDNLPSEKQQRLLAESPYSSWEGGAPGRKFLVAANVGLFYDPAELYDPAEPPIVPDVFLSMDVEVADDWWEKRHRSYFLWEFGKPPEIVIEIVSNRVGGEADTKLAIYAQIGVDYYVIFDPLRLLSNEILRVYKRNRNSYRRMRQTWFPEVGLGLRLWEGLYEGKWALWLRWCDREGRLIPTGAERAARAERHALQAQQQAEQAEQRAEQEAAARRAAEAELAQIRAELARLRGDQPAVSDEAP